MPHDIYTACELLHIMYIFRKPNYIHLIVRIGSVWVGTWFSLAMKHNTIQWICNRPTTRF